MTMYYAGTVRSIGGRKKRAVYRFQADNWVELKAFADRWGENCVLLAPPRGVHDYKSKIMPNVLLDAVCTEEAADEGAVRVSDRHILVLAWLQRREFYALRHEITPEIEKFFELGTRGAMVKLLRAGEWYEHPKNSGHVILNVKLEKIDLGRRSDLRYARKQDSTKYDQDMRKDRLQELYSEPGPDDAYIQADATTRARMRGAKPWMASKWIRFYGE